MSDSPANSNDEQGRLRALHRYGVLYSARESNFDAITSIVRDLLGVPICAVSLIDEQRQWFKSTQGLDMQEGPRSEAFCDHIIRDDVSMVVEDATKDARFKSNPLVTGDPHIRSYAGHPLVTPDGYRVGSLCAIGREPKSFSPSELALLERFAALVVDQLELRTLAHRDFLTSALTRRAFIDHAESCRRQLARAKRPAWLVLVDIDHFKEVNDCFGHPIGDEVLKQVAGAVMKALRPIDSFGRLGGEEFAVLLPDVSESDVMPCAERLRQTIAAMNVPDLPKITASFGIAPLSPDRSLDDTMAAADAALYAAKRGGRNCCRLASGLNQAAAA